MIRWRALVPPRSGWLRLVSSPTSYLLSLGYLATVLAKTAVLGDLEGIDGWPLWIPSVVALDGTIFLGLAALFAAGENSNRWLYVATLPLALLMAVIALINALHLGITGEQFTWAAFWLGWKRFGDLGAILADQRDHLETARATLLIAIAAMTPAVLLIGRRRGKGAKGSTSPGLVRAHCAASVAAVSAALWLVSPATDSLSLTRLRGNAAAMIYWDWLTGAEQHVSGSRAIWFERYDPSSLVAPSELENMAGRPRPHVLLVVLESARYDYTSLAGEAARAKTPNLLALARTGLNAPIARAVVPHTTKSLFSMICGRLPLMQVSTIEVSADLEIECLATLLARAGYRTGFFQSALGWFEDRPRLVRQLGFEHFEAWEEIGGEPLGYLASDDQSLPDAVARWLDRGEARLGEDPIDPFFAVVLTSAAHHPYRLPTEVAEQAHLEEASMQSDAERYARLMEGADRVLGSLLVVLEQRGLRDDTIVIVAGDHGEGFGTKGVRQHDNNFYEEGLRVPLVFAGPRVPRGDVEGNASLVDIVPTLLELLDVPLTPEAEHAIFGQSLVRAPPTGPRWFGCWYAVRCRGFVDGSTKVVHIPGSGTFRFDLAEDPNEQHAMPLASEHESWLPELHRVIDAHHAPRRSAVLGEVTGYGEWQCPENVPCSHPRSRTATAP